MAQRISRIVIFFFLFVTVVAHFAWGEVKHITILYSNNINGEINPRG